MREPYQMDLFDLEEKEYQPVTNTPIFMTGVFYYCPKCGDLVGHYTKEGKDKGWHFVKDICRNGHKMNWEAIK